MTELHTQLPMDELVAYYRDEHVVDDDPKCLALEVDRLQTIIDKLCVGTYYWDDRSLNEASPDSISDAVDGDAPGEIVVLRPIHELPPIYVLVTEDGYKEFDTPEAAEAAQEK